MTIFKAQRHWPQIAAPSEPFEGGLVKLFVSDAPRVLGPSFDVMRLAQDYVADEAQVIQDPILVEHHGRQIVTTRYLGKDTHGQPLIYLAGFVLESKVLTVLLAATPEATETTFLPIFAEMLFSIELKPTWK